MEERRREAGALAKELKELLKGAWNPWVNEIEKPRSLGPTIQEMYDFNEATFRKESKHTHICTLWAGCNNRAMISSYQVSSQINRHLSTWTIAAAAGSPAGTSITTGKMPACYLQ